jgi:two-component system, NtrC family, response regulator HydG
MVVVDSDGVLDVDDLTEDLVALPSPAFGDGVAPAGGPNLVGRPLDEVEAYYIAETLKLTGGNREEAAKLLGIGERTLYRKIKEYRIG